MIRIDARVDSPTLTRGLLDLLVKANEVTDEDPFGPNDKKNLSYYRLFLIKN